MTSPPSSRPASSRRSGPDPELAALPGPRRPWRRATLVSLALTVLASSALCVALTSQLLYALEGGQPTEVGSLTELKPTAELENTWVHGVAQLDKRAVGYRRPLEPDRFRLSRVEGNPALWVELREPSDSLGEHFVPPTSFVGRLVPLSSPGLRHAGVADALRSSGQSVPDSGDWLLIDGESPASARWVFGVWALLLAFLGFSLFGTVRLLRPIPATVTGPRRSRAPLS